MTKTIDRVIKYPKIVEVLRKAGVTVRVQHYRNAIGWYEVTPSLQLVTEMNKGSFRTILSHGGATHIEVTFPDNEEKVIYAIAACSIKDQYCRKSGIDVAFERMAKSHPNVIEFYNQFKSNSFPSQSSNGIIKN